MGQHARVTLRCNDGCMTNKKVGPKAARRRHVHAPGSKAQSFHDPEQQARDHERYGAPKSVHARASSWAKIGRRSILAASSPIGSEMPSLSRGTRC